jgi:hypothetical protein
MEDTASPFDALSMKILKSDKSILSLTINDDRGEVVGRAYGKAYEKKYLELAKEIRNRAGLFSALIFGIATEPEKIFGETKAIVRIYAKVKLVLIPFPSRKFMATLLTKTNIDTYQLVKRTRPLLKEP